MTGKAQGSNLSCLDIGKSLAVYFSEFLTGEFANSFIEFNNLARLVQFVGDNPYDKFHLYKNSYVGSTNFQSVIDLFCQLKKSGIEESHFPKGLLLISDCEFNPASLNKTNVELAMFKLEKAGFSKEYVDNFIMVFWNLATTYYGNSKTKFETYGKVKNVFYFGGFSPSVITFLTNKIDNAWELFNKSMDQELLNKIEL